LREVSCAFTAKDDEGGALPWRPKPGIFMLAIIKKMLQKVKKIICKFFRIPKQYYKNKKT